MATLPRRPTPADKIEVLRRIYRAADRAGDAELRRAAADELAAYDEPPPELTTASLSTSAGGAPS